jgi:hypothetical protein
MTDLIARSVNRSKTADMRCSPRLLLTIPTHLLPPLRWLVRVVVIIFCPPLLLAREEEFKKLVVLEVNIFNAFLFTLLSLKSKHSLSLSFSLCVCARGKNNAVSLSLSIYIYIYLFPRVVVFDDDIFLNSANEAHTHRTTTTTTTTTTVRSLGNSSSRRGVFFRRLHDATLKNRKKSED